MENRKRKKGLRTSINVSVINDECECVSGCLPKCVGVVVGGGARGLSFFTDAPFPERQRPLCYNLLYVFFNMSFFLPT